MPYHSHKLNSTQSHIIGRTDPITGDIVQQKDNVVFCSVCKSCFLEESWVYMSERHCEQIETLKTIPTLPSKLIAKKETTQLITELLSTKVDFDVVSLATIFPCLITFLCLSAIEHNFGIKINYIITLLVGGLGGLLASIISSKPKFRNITGNQEDDIRIFRNYIEIGKQRFFLKEVKQIKYQRETHVERVDGREIYSPSMPCLLVYLNDGSFIKQNLPTAEYKKTAPFLRGLEKISYFKEVFFYSENKIEYQTMQVIQSKSNGNIVIGEPARLFHNL